MRQLLFVIIPAIITLGHSIRPPIIEGTEANLHEFPYQVSLQWNFNNGSRPQHFCSGSILNRAWILTAAHCMEQQNREGWYEIVAGVNNIAQEESGAQRRNVSRYVVHPSYGAVTLKNDIAVIHLSEPLHLNGNIRTMRLATSSTIILQKHAKFAGWGSISKTMVDIFPDLLMKVTMPLRTLEECEWNGRIDRTQVCAGGYRNVSACTADSGGPLTVTMDGEEVQIGVASFGEKPCLATYPIVFTSVIHFYDWIQSAIADS